MRNYLLLFLCVTCLSAQGQKKTGRNLKYGVWQTFGNPMPPDLYPEVNGRLCNFRWKDIETAPNVWNWSSFDSSLAVRAKDSLPVIFMVYTEEDAPDWLYSAGVPKVMQQVSKTSAAAPAPYYADSLYKFYFKRMVSTVRAHLETLPTEVRKQILAVQACFGSTGDYIGYKGPVDPKYYLSAAQWFSLFKEFSTHFYNEYKNASPKIYLLSNPGNKGSEQTNWLLQNCPNNWIKTTNLGKGYQLNGEVTKSKWLYDILNKPQNGEYIRSRAEIVGDNVVAPWWNKHPYKNMFAMFCYDIYWGLDWSNQSALQILDTNYVPAFRFYNKYAGEKDPLQSANAVCALKDGLDALDTNRFPIAEFGALNDPQRKFNILAPFVEYGALLEDPVSADSNETANVEANGINDVGRDIFPGNYDRYLHQITPNATSAGYWNVPSSDTNTIYGRFARGFDLAKNKDGLYFDLDDNFLGNTAINASYPVMIEVTYLDKGKGSFQLFYDAVKKTDKPSIAITCNNTNTWKKASVTLKDANFYNRGLLGSDFYIKNTGSENVLFSVVEVTRPKSDSSNMGFKMPNNIAFDSLCAGLSSAPKSFLLNASFLNGTKVVLGPLKGFSFSTDSSGEFLDSLVFKNPQATFLQRIFVKFQPAKGGVYTNKLLVKGGGVAKQKIELRAVAVAAPVLDAAINNITCANAKNGAINLTVTQGQAPFNYSWRASVPFKSANEDIDSLIPGDYTVQVSSVGGCSVSNTYTVTQPEPLSISFSADPMICKGGTTNVYIQGLGGTAPYTGTGTFTAASGYPVFSIADANGCTAKKTYYVPNGSLVAPDKPVSINSTLADATGVCNASNLQYEVSAVANATSYTWYLPEGTSIVSTSNAGLSMSLKSSPGFASGTLSVAANNACGSSVVRTKTIFAAPATPGLISGPVSVIAGKTGLIYSVQAVGNLSYLWSVPPGSSIISGQGSNTILVNWGTRSGNVTVKAVNDCGTSTYNSSLAVSLQNVAAATLGTLSALVAETAVSVFPNPAKDVAQVSFTAKESGMYTIQLKTATGNVVHTHLMQAAKGSNNTRVSLNGFSAGMYFVTITGARGDHYILKLLKQ